MNLADRINYFVLVPCLAWVLILFIINIGNPVGFIISLVSYVALLWVFKVKILKDKKENENDSNSRN